MDLGCRMLPWAFLSASEALAAGPKALLQHFSVSRLRSLCAEENWDLTRLQWATQCYPERECLIAWFAWYQSKTTYVMIWCGPFDRRHHLQPLQRRSNTFCQPHVMVKRMHFLYHVMEHIEGWTRQCSEAFSAQRRRKKSLTLRTSSCLENGWKLKYHPVGGSCTFALRVTNMEVKNHLCILVLSWEKGPFGPFGAIHFNEFKECTYMTCKFKETRPGVYVHALYEYFRRYTFTVRVGTAGCLVNWLLSRWPFLDCFLTLQCDRVDRSDGRWSEKYGVLSRQKVKIKTNTHKYTKRIKHAV